MIPAAQTVTAPPTHHAHMLTAPPTPIHRAIDLVSAVVLDVGRLHRRVDDPNVHKQLERIQHTLFDLAAILKQEL